MTWPEQDPYSSPPYSSAPYQSNPQSGPPANPYSQDPYAQQAQQYPQGQPQYQQYPPAQPQYPPAQQYPQQAGYPAYGYQAPASASTNTLAILALVFAFVFSPAAIVLGHMAKKQIRQTGEQGEGLATAGLIIGYISVGIMVVVCGFWIIAVIAATSSTSTV